MKWKNKDIVCKEQPRALAIWDADKLRAKVDYIHANPVRRKLVESPQDWEFSSYGFYGCGRKTLFEITPYEP